MEQRKVESGYEFTVQSNLSIEVHHQPHRDVTRVIINGIESTHYGRKPDDALTETLTRWIKRYMTHELRDMMSADLQRNG